MKRFSIWLLAMSIVAFSCSKKDYKADTSKKGLLTAGPWKIVAFTVNPPYDLNSDGTPETSDLFALLPACRRDNLLTFKADGFVVADEGSTKCESGDPQIISTDTWEFRNNETQMFVRTDDDSFLVTILELSSTSLKLQLEETEDGTKYTYTESYTR